MCLLANQAPFKQRLYIPAPVEDAVNEYVLSDHLIDTAIWLEMNLPIICHSDSIEFGREMTPLGQVSEPRTE